MTSPGGGPGGWIAARPFATAFRGFDKGEVRRFLEELADDQQALADRAARAEKRLADLQSRLQSVEELLEAADSKYQTAQNHLANLQAERELAAAQPPADPELAAVRAFGDQVTEVLQIAVSAGNSIRAQAEAWAEQRRAEAVEDAAMAIDTARREVAEIVAREEGNVGQLKATEEALRDWLQAAHRAIGQVLAQPSVGPGELASVMGRIRELGPTGSAGPDSAMADPQSIAMDAGSVASAAGTVTVTVESPTSETDGPDPALGGPDRVSPPAGLLIS